jgi:hypothetical protein
LALAADAPAKARARADVEMTLGTVLHLTIPAPRRYARAPFARLGFLGGIDT